MAEPYFADAWYYVALLEPRDSHHSRATRLKRYVEHTVLLTHEGVLTEVLAYFARAGERARALAVQAVRRSLSTVVVVTIDRPLFLTGLERYEARPDKEYSLIDCISMVLMEQMGIEHVLTNDHHFRQEGFTVLSDPP